MSQKNPVEKATSVLALMSVALLWGSAYTLIKSGLQFLDPVAMVAYRFGLAAIILGIFLLFKKRAVLKDFRYGLVLGILLGVAFIAQTIGLGYTSATNGGFVTGTFVIFVPFFAWIVGKRPSITKLFAAIISFFGLIILTGGAQGFMVGDVLVLVSAVAFSLQFVAVDVFVNKKLDVLVLAFQQFLVASMGSFLFALIFHFPLTIQSPEAIKLVLFLALINTLYAYVVQLFAQQHVSSVQTSLIMALEPVTAAVVAWAVGRESIHPSQLFGGVLIIFAIIISEVLGSFIQVNVSKRFFDWPMRKLKRI